MLRRISIQVGLLGLAFSCATALFGWWAVPCLAAFWGLYDRPRNRPALIASAAAGLGWALILIWAATQGPLLQLSSRASEVLSAPGPTLMLLTLMLPMVLGWSAGALGGTVRHLWERQRARR